MTTLAPCHDRSTHAREAFAAPRKPVVLVVEDHEFAREALAALLATEGYDVIEAENGREALAAMAKGAPPDVILLDLMMPVMDGWEFMKRQRSDWRLFTIPTIAVTGAASPHPPGPGVPGARFLGKPYTAGPLVAALDAGASVSAPS